MDNPQDFKPENEEERKMVERYNSTSIETSKVLRRLSEEKRLPYLKAANPSNTSLMNLYLMALKNEDYETCTVAKVLLVERGIEIPENQ